MQAAPGGVAFDVGETIFEAVMLGHHIVFGMSHALAFDPG